LTILILTFSNSVFADVDDGVYSDDNGKGYATKRCKVEYTRLDLITGTETIYKNTSQFGVLDACKEGLEKLSKKLYKWIDKKNTNLITKINEFRCKQKSTMPSFPSIFSVRWGGYRDCDTYIQKLSAYLVNEYPKQLGAKVFQDSIAD
jgi:hypothetical protein